MKIKPEHLEQLELEVQHIFNSGANEVRVYNMIQAFIEKRGKALFIPDVVGRSGQLKAEVFTLANKLAVAGEGDAAVAMHRIHNRL